MRHFYLITRDLHLYAGLFIGPFVLVFAISVFFLVHAWAPGGGGISTRHVSNLRIPAGIEALSGRARVDAVRGVLDQVGVGGEIGYIIHVPKDHRLIVPVSVPGRETALDIDLERKAAAITVRETGLADGLIVLHKSPGPHLADIRMNWLPVRIWQWLADATVYLLLFLSVSGIYLWTAVRSERRIGIALLAAGAFSFFGIIYALIR